MLQSSLHASDGAASSLQWTLVV